MFPRISRWRASISFARYSDPPITTIAQPAEDFGREAVSLLVSMIEGTDVKRDARRIMPFELVVRSSTGPAPR